MHGLWNTMQQYRREDCNAYCADPTHAMVVWSNLDTETTTERLCGWNPEVVILSVSAATEAPIPDGDAGRFIRALELRPMLVRFRVVMETPEAA